MRYLEFDPYIPLALWASLAVAAAAMLGVYAWACRKRLSPRRWRGIAALMTLSAALPLVLLLNPTWVERVPPLQGKPLLTVLLDASASMATKDVAAEAAGSKGATRERFDAARAIADQLSKSLASRFDVEVRTFSSTTALSSSASLAATMPDGSATDLAAALSEAVADDRPQGQAVVLLSDGAHNAGAAGAVQESAARAKAAGVPVYAHTLGSATGVRDLELTLPSTQELSFVGQKVSLRAAIRQRGDFVRQSKATLKLGGKVVESRDVDLAADGVTYVDFQVQPPQVGLYRYDVSLAAHADEVTDVNNAATMLVRVVKEPVRVLLLEGKPYWDTKFLIRTLGGDSSIALTTVVRMAQGRLLEREFTSADGPPSGPSSAAAPGSDSKLDAATVARSERWSIQTDAAKLLADPATLSKYQVIVLGRDAEVFLSDESVAQLRRWLNAGEGSLVCFRGAPSTQLSERLANLLPVRWSPQREARFRVKLTPSGQDLHWLPVALRGDDPLSKLPSLSTVAHPQSRPALTSVLATAVGDKQPAKEDPVVSYQPVGLGRVVVIEGAGMWRWAFLPHTYQQFDEVYGTLWRSLTRWLVTSSSLLPSQKLALRTDQVTFSAGDAIGATLLVREDQWKGDVPNVSLLREAPAGQPATSTSPHVITPLPTGDAAGQYTVAFGKLPEGRYEARVVGVDEPTARVAFDVRGNLRERLDVAAQPDLMKLIARQSGGATLSSVEPETLARQFEGYLAKSRPDRTLRTPAWDRWWVLAAVAAIWGTAWGVRRHSGLV